MKAHQKRNLFEELKQGIEEVNAYKQGKLTLRTYTAVKKTRPHIDAELIRKIRAELNMSRNVFALRLRVSPRTLEKWEQGTVVPNEQAAALLLMVYKYPDTLKRLENL